MTSPPIPIALHYFRIPRHSWELMLARMRQLGAGAIYTPLPWGFHEFSANKFDLSGLTNPRRNVTGFVNLCLEMGFRVILDLIPGPEANLLNGGFPGWLLGQHPEIQARDAQGKALPALTPAHPTTLKFIERWFRQASQTLIEQQSTGRAVTGQISLRRYPLDYNEHVATVQWPVWLRQRYVEGGIESLNAAYVPDTPYRSFSKVPLRAPLESPAFRQDVADFTLYWRDHAAKIYSAMLQEGGWTLAEAIDAPRHGVQINPDPADVGESFQWAMDAPVRPDASPRYNFWTLKKANLEAALSDAAPIYVAETGQTVSIPVENGALVGRLALDGGLEQTVVETEERGKTLIAANKTGATDLYFTLPTADAPLPDYLDGALRSLLTSKTQTLTRCAAMIAQLLAAFEKPSPPDEQEPDPSISQAQLALAEANLALYKAAASIGALEEVFAVALDKPQQLETAPPFLTLDAAQFEPLRTACQTAAPLLQTAGETSLPAPFTIEQYRVAHNSVVTDANQAVEVLAAALRWLREGLAAKTLPPTAWAVHAQLQTILQSLAQI